MLIGLTFEHLLSVSSHISRYISMTTQLQHYTSQAAIAIRLSLYLTPCDLLSPVQSKPQVLRSLTLLAVKPWMHLCKEPLTTRSNIWRQDNTLMYTQLKQQGIYKSVALTAMEITPMRHIHIKLWNHLSKCLTLRVARSSWGYWWSLGTSH